MNKLAKRGSAPVGLLKVEEARAQLAASGTVREAKEIGDKAAAVAKYLRKQRHRWDEALDAEEIALEAHIRSGEILAGMQPGKQRVGRGRPKKIGRGVRFSDLLGVDTQAANKLAQRQAKAVVIRERQPERLAAYVKQQRQTYGAITLTGLIGERTGAAVHVSQNTGQPEWYTPREYLEAARAVLGRIDLDPASSMAAQQNVKAEKFYTAKDDGLAQQWVGRVWMNPPYTAGLVDRFVEKLCVHVADGSVPEAILLVNNATDTAWFQLGAKRAVAICFPAGRIRFLNEANEPAGAPLQGQTLIYFGERVAAFIEVFGSFGFCARLVA